ncbi:MAG: hypothetical protein ABI370_07520 [Gammaproteobacteria bacterium]
MKMLLHFFKNRAELFKKFIGKFQIIWDERKALIIIITSLIAVLFFSYTYSHKNTTVTDLISLQNKRSDVILRELNDINSVLHDVESNPSNTKQQQIALQSLEKNISSAQKAMTDVAKSTDIQKISNQISLVKDDIDSQMSDIKNAVSKNINTKEYLDASALPFRVISVDVIAGQYYVSVEYANHVSPLSVGDSLVGWRVVDADYDAGISEFTNEKNQFIKVSLQGT